MFSSPKLLSINSKTESQIFLKNPKVISDETKIYGMNYVIAFFLDRKKCR